MNGPLVLMVAVTCLWGTSSALLATLAAPTTAGLVALGGAVPLLIWARLRGQHPWATLTAHPALYFRLGGLEAANLALYVAALRMGPLPVVVALHLTAPVLIIAAALVRGRRAPTLTSIATQAALPSARAHPVRAAICASPPGCRQATSQIAAPTSSSSASTGSVGARRPRTSAAAMMRTGAVRCRAT
ncbi:hypothetical protein, partial [Nocardia sp. 852002-51244_SCH5132740]|uniref:hypothetical protein n=2 Tax=unclassified Nocardia TaxID=2637762 RepID=UPI000A7AA291